VDGIEEVGDELCRVVLYEVGDFGHAEVSYGFGVAIVA
jgi:hypothetical protein